MEEDTRISPWGSRPGCHLQEEGSHSGKLQSQSEASAGNTRQYTVVTEASWALVPAAHFPGVAQSLLCEMSMS